MFFPPLFFLLVLLNPSEPAELATRDLVPPTPLLATRSSNGFVQLNWSRDPNRPLSNFHLYRLNSDRWTLLTASPYPETVFLDFAPPFGEVTYRVVLLDEVEEETSQSATATVSITAAAASWISPETYTFDKNNII